MNQLTLVDLMSMAAHLPPHPLGHKAEETFGFRAQRRGDDHVPKGVVRVAPMGQVQGLECFDNPSCTPRKSLKGKS